MMALIAETLIIFSVLTKKIHFMRTVVTIDNLKIEQCSQDAFYISIDGLTIYVDVSIEGEKHVSHWIDESNDVQVYNY
jgi:hypothetical protein